MPIAGAGHILDVHQTRLLPFPLKMPRQIYSNKTSIEKAIENPIIPRYSIEKSILFVGFAWRTDMFSVHGRGAEPREELLASRLQKKIVGLTHRIPGRVPAVLAHMVSSIDKFEAKLQLYPAGITALGLGDKPPDYPYCNIPQHLLNDLATTYISAIIVDRILWALHIGTLEPLGIQYVHGDFQNQVRVLDLSLYNERIVSIAQRFAATEDYGVQYPDSLPGDNVRCGVASVKHEAFGGLHQVASQLYYAATVFLLHGTVRLTYYTISAQ